MLRLFRDLHYILPKKERVGAFRVLFLMSMVAIFEAAGVASVMPVIAAILSPETLQRSSYFLKFSEFTGYTWDDYSTYYFAAVFCAVMLTVTSLKITLQWQQLKYAKMQVHNIGIEFLIRALGKRYEWFLLKDTSRLSTIILSEINHVISSSLLRLLIVITHVLVALALFAVVLIIDWKLALGLGFVLGALYFILYTIIKKPLTKIGKRRMEFNRFRYKLLNEILEGVKDIKIRGISKEMVARFELPSYETARQEIKGSLLEYIPGTLMQFVIFVSIIGLILFLQSKHGSVESAMPTFAAFAFASYRLMPSLQQIFLNVSGIRAGRPLLSSLVSELRDIRDREYEEDVTQETNIDSSDAIEFKSIGLKDVYYKYPKAQDYALKGVSLEAKKNSIVALVGESGSGKSTVVDIILGLLKPSKGGIILNGSLVNSRAEGFRRNIIGYVPQFIFISDDTIANNIAFGVGPESVDMDAVIRAAKLANIHEMIMSLPDGYQTRVGQRGVKFSGGQRQRLGIARALYHDPPVLVMDEATSALDSPTEQIVMDAVNSLSDRKTVILIAHRFTTIKNSDVIYVLQNGMIQATGKFDELMASSDYFKRLSGME